MNPGKWFCLIAMLATAFYGLPTFAQAPTAQNLAGDWRGTLGTGAESLPLVLHLTTAPDGKLNAALDSPAQGGYGIPGNNVQITGSNFSFEVPSVHGSYTGTLSADGKTISGSWTQGKPLPLVLQQTATAAELAQVKPSPIDGDWSGVLSTGDASLRLVFHFHAAPGDKIDGTLDSLDQGAMGLPFSVVKLDGRQLSLGVPNVGGIYKATLSADGNKLTGTWVQHRVFPLDLTRQAEPAAATGPQPAGYPIALKDLKPVLDKEFASVIAAWPEVGVVVGVLDHGERKVFAYGTARADSIFEIGSVTKTFTGLALAQMVQQHVVALDQPVRELLPAGSVSKPAAPPEITLLDLATQHSGLPRLPSNMHPEDQADPYAHYTAKDLYDFLAKQGVGHPEPTGFLYSNLGFGLLGQALAVKANESYEALIRRQITGPLGMKDTTVALSPSQQARLIQGYNGAHDKAHVWTFDALAGAGALHSTVDDLLTYTEAYLHPEKLPAASAGPALTLAAALRMAQQPQADGPGALKIALGWLVRPETDVYWHDGGTAGYSALVTFEPKRDRAIVVLYDCLDMMPGKPVPADGVAANVTALLDGKPVPPIGK
ncbi:MAG: serine hydrolase domain-containing protein [Candidatus Korobacteraceae bacterium]|jgi:CubicO group peptidase (beta-lactamase class C family)